ncbi:MAG: helix-turn-helix transcriptional regulator [Chitinophagaceae bacterium]|nr:helix-turn-helix transcriptional regulator [Chitinophagaceae bacterium]
MLETSFIINKPFKVVKPVRLSAADLRCIDLAVEYIHKHYTDKISADQLSIEVGLSKEKLQAGIQGRKGQTLARYIQQVRLEKAKELLANTNQPVKAVADAAGFINESHFCKVFRKVNFISPIQYRFQQACC